MAITQVDSEGLQVVADGLEVAVSKVEKEVVYEGIEQIPYKGSRPPTILGVRRRIFWVLLSIAIIVAVVGGIGGALANRKSPPAAPDSIPPPPKHSSNSSVTSSEKTSPFVLFPPINHTALSLASWRPSSNQDVRAMQLFYQTSSGALRGREWTSAAGWSDDSFSIANITAKKNTPIAQTSWTGADGSREIRLFYLKANNVLCNAVYTMGAWFNGNLESKNITVGENGKVGATVWDNNTELRVYYQDTNNTMQELVWANDAWSMGTPSLVYMAPGAGLVALTYVDDNEIGQIRIYTQNATGSIVSKDYGTGDGWREPYQLYGSPKTPLGTSVTASMVNTDGERQGLASMAVYFVGEGGKVRKTAWMAGTGVWNLELAGLVQGDLSGAVAAVDWNSRDARLVYEKSGGGELGEIKLAGNGGPWNATDFGT